MRLCRTFHIQTVTVSDAEDRNGRRPISLFPYGYFRSMSSGKMPSLLGLESELVRIKGWLWTASFSCPRQAHPKVANLFNMTLHRQADYPRSFLYTRGTLEASHSVSCCHPTNPGINLSEPDFPYSPNPFNASFQREKFKFLFLKKINLILEVPAKHSYHLLGNFK
jgi:hypothetical protein